VEGKMNDHQARESWASRTAEHLVDGVLATVERLPIPDQECLLRAVASRALWHMPNAATEARNLARVMDIESLKEPHLRDKPPDRD
jgi:hypothetical protein